MKTLKQFTIKEASPSLAKFAVDDWSKHAKITDVKHHEQHANKHYDRADYHEEKAGDHEEKAEDRFTRATVNRYNYEHHLAKAVEHVHAMHSHDSFAKQHRDRGDQHMDMVYQLEKAKGIR